MRHWVCNVAKPREEITITLPNGKEEKGTSWETTPLMIAKGISKSLLERTVITKVDGELWDLTRPMEKSCKLELIDFESAEGKKDKTWTSKVEREKAALALTSGQKARLFSGIHLPIFSVRHARDASGATSATDLLRPTHQASTTIWPTWKGIVMAFSSCQVLMLTSLRVQPSCSR